MAIWVQSAMGIVYHIFLHYVISCPFTIVPGQKILQFLTGNHY
jgi:hypothetical protein